VKSAESGNSDLEYGPIQHGGLASNRYKDYPCKSVAEQESCRSVIYSRDYDTRTVIRFFSISAKYDICTVVGLNGRLVVAKIRTFECPRCLC
jgi:hypothetical protein